MKRTINNYKHQTKTFTIGTILFFIILIIPSRVLLSLFKLNDYPISSGELIVVLFLVSIVSIPLLEKRFVSLLIDDDNNYVELIQKSLLLGKSYKKVPFELLNYKLGRDSGNIRKSATDFIEIFSGKSKLTRLEKSVIGEDTFSKVFNEINAIASHNKSIGKSGLTTSKAN